MAEPPAAALGTRDQSGHGDEASWGERRHLTVLFCDLVGSTQIATRLDSEEWRAIVGGYHRAAAQAIERFGGYVAQYLGDGVMAFFGYPEEHGNDGQATKLVARPLPVSEGWIKGEGHYSVAPALAVGLLQSRTQAKACATKKTLSGAARGLKPAGTPISP